MLIAGLVGHKPTVNLLVGRGGDETDQADDDDPQPGQQERSPAQSVHQQQGEEGGDHLDQPQQDGGQACQGLPTEPHGLGDVGWKYFMRETSWWCCLVSSSLPA